MAGKLVIKVVKIKGKCPVYSVGDRIVLDEGYKLNLKETTNVCMHSLASIMPYYNALYNGVAPEKLGLPTRKERLVCSVSILVKLLGAGRLYLKLSSWRESEGIPRNYQ